LIARKRELIMKKILEILAPARWVLGQGLSTARLVTALSHPRGSFLMSFLIIALLPSTSAWGQEVIHEAFPETVPVPKQAVSEPRPVPVSLGLVGAFQEGRNVHDIGPLSAAEIAAADKAATSEFADVNPGPVRVGVVRSVGPVPLSIESGSALQIQLADGRKLWTLEIRSPGAFGIRIHFSNFNVGNGSAVVYARDVGSLIVRGPYTGKGPDSRGEFWTESLPGDTVFIEVSGTVEPRLEVAEIVHRDKDPAGSAQELKGSMAAPEPPLSCHLDVMCYDNPPVNPSARDAVGRAFFVTADVEYGCTGTLLDDLDPDTFVPYFLTANHCISTQAVADTLEVVYLWQRSSCGGPLPNFYLLPGSSGGTLLEHTSQHGGNDMSFIRLRGNLPGGVTLAGWTTASQGDGITGIHHPGGGGRVFIELRIGSG
jgi:hypothetical protein